ncbi:MAG: exonuclease domain-containing protein [Pseudomonadota bacterium]|nr:exonuclease domain-containing protein [Pseudomonadota bacterium]
MAAPDHPFAGEIACVDLETTGGHAVHNRVIEAAVVVLSEGRVVEEYSTLVNPGTRIPYAIQQFTGITEAMVADAPPFAAVSSELLARLEGRLFVAHNVRFDYGFLRSEFHRLGIRFRAPLLCTVRLSRALTPGIRGHNLDAVMERYGIGCDARHRALGDARVLADFLRIAVERFPPAELACIVDRLRAVPRLPAALDPSVADELPEAPGVYLIYGENDALLHVGKAKNLATRALSHFGEPRTQRERELQALARRIEWIETAGEFGALVTEARFVKDRMPLLTRRRRDIADHWTIRLSDDPAAPGATIGTFDTEDDAQDAYGMFRRRGDAERALEGIAREHQLCRKRLGIEAGEGSCIGYAPGRCRGACVGVESPVLHTLRARLALSGLKRRDWPFPGRIGIRERDWRGHEEIHVFDRWCHLGVVSCGFDLSECEERPRIFDPDVYRILTGFLDRPIAGAELLRLDGNRSP